MYKMRNEITSDYLSSALLFSSFIKRKSQKIILYEKDSLIQNKIYLYIFRFFKIPLELKTISVSSKAPIYQRAIDTLQTEEKKIDPKIINLVMKITGLSKKISILYIKKHYRSHLVSQEYLKTLANPLDKSYILAFHDFSSFQKKTC